MLQGIEKGSSSKDPNFRENLGKVCMVELISLYMEAWPLIFSMRTWLRPLGIGVIVIVEEDAHLTTRVNRLMINSQSNQR